jgi:hypothetical protein
LGSRENRQISIVNSFELVLLTEPDTDNEHPLWPIDRDFFQTRQGQCELTASKDNDKLIGSRGSLSQSGCSGMVYSRLGAYSG